MTLKSTAVLALLSGTAFVGLPAVAQTAARPAAAIGTAGGTLSSATPAQSASSLAENGIADIIVTAQRKSESSQRAAIAIDVIRPEALTQVTQAEDLTRLAPAVQFGTAGGASPVLYIRGVGTYTANPYTDSAIAVNYDGIYLGRPTSTTGLFYDLDRVEVLKGPQGTLYGRNATGGALNIIPMEPKIGVREMSATISAGNYQAVNGQAAINLPISDTLAFRAAGTTYTHDAYNTDGTYTERGEGGRAQLLFKPRDGLSLRVGGDYFHLGGTGPTGILLAKPDPATGAAMLLNLGPDVGLYDPRSVAVLNSTFVGLAGTTFGAFPQQPDLNNKYYGVNAEGNADLGFAKLTVVAAWRRSDLDNVVSPTSFVITTEEKDEQYSLETRLSGNIGPFDWLIGGYYFSESVNAAYIINENFLGSVQTLDAKNKSYAGFGRLTWHVTDTLRLTGAARYTQDDKTFDGLADVVTGICTSPTHLCPNIRRLPADVSNLSAALAKIGYIQPPGVPVYIDATGTSNAIYSPSQIVVNQGTSPSKVTYRGAAEFEPRPGSLLYSSVETGFRAGGFSFSTIRPVFNPETITAYTIGSKNRFFDNRLQLNVEAFLWQYKDQQISHEALGRTGGIEFVTENIGSSTNKGVEAELTAKPLRNTVLNADVQYLNARNKSFRFNDVDSSLLAGLPAGSIPPATQCPYSVVPNAGTYRIDCSGLRALRSPVWTINLGIQQSFDLPNGFKLTVEGHTHYQTSNIVMFERAAFSVQGSYWTSDAAITLYSADRTWSVAAFVNNIENERFLTNAFDNTFNGLTSGSFSPPRTYGARISFHL